MTQWDMFKKATKLEFSLFNMSQCVICSPVWPFVPRDCPAANGPLRHPFVAVQRGCSRQVTRIPSTLADGAEIASLLQERGKLEARMDDFANAHLAKYATLEREDHSLEQNSRFDVAFHSFREAFRVPNERIAVARSEDEDRGPIPSTRSKSSKSSEASMLQSKEEPRWLPRLLD